MLTALISLVVATSALVLILLAVVVVGIKQEPPSAELSSQAPSLMAAVVRRMLGVSVRKPAPPADNADTRNACLTGHATSDEGR